MLAACTESALEDGNSAPNADAAGDRNEAREETERKTAELFSEESLQERSPRSETAKKTRAEAEREATEIFSEESVRKTLSELPTPTAISAATPAESIANLPASRVQLPPVEPLDVTGNISLAGSFTLTSLLEATYQRFIDEGYAGTIEMDSLGSSDGFRMFCQQGEADASKASRQISETEIARCNDRGLQPVELYAGTDAIAIVVNKENEFLEDISLEMLARAIVAERWSEVNPAWPDTPIERFVPSQGSGTLQVFVNRVLGGDNRPLERSTNTFRSGDMEELAWEIGRDRNAIGFFSYAVYKHNTDRLRILSVGGIEVNADTVESDRYPLTRPLFLYTDRQIVRRKPQVGAFLNFYLANANEMAGALGYFPIPADKLDASKERLLEMLPID